MPASLTPSPTIAVARELALVSFVCFTQARLLLGLRMDLAARPRDLMLRIDRGRIGGRLARRRGNRSRPVGRGR